MLLFFVSTAVLSRLLSPREFGVFALISALNTIIGVSFQEFGGANYLIQKASLSKHDIRTAFTVMFCVSALIGMGLYACGGTLAWFFQQEGLKTGIAVSALNFALTPFSVTVSALFRRDMRFGTLAICNLVGSFAGAAISILLAILDYSFMAPI